jgi:hypothetical protein
MILVAKSITVDLLATCRQIHQEYTPVFNKLARALRSEPIRFIVDSTSLEYFFGHDLGLCVIEYVIEARAESLSSGPANNAELLGRSMNFPKILMDQEGPDSGSVSRFARKCGRYLSLRTLDDSVFAVRRYPGHEWEGYYGFIMTIHKTLKYCATLPPGFDRIGWLMHGLPRGQKIYSSGYGFIWERDYLRAILEEGGGLRITQSWFWLDDTSGNEWSSVWEEGELIE